MNPGASTLERGTALLRDGDPAAALPLLQQAVQALPDNARAAFRVGMAAFALGDYQMAADAFRSAGRLDPQWIEAWSNLAAALARLEAYDEALEVARHALTLDPRRIASWEALAALLSNRFDQDSLQEGLRAIDRVLRATPGSAQAHHVAGLLWRKRGDAARAIAYGRRALALSPTNPDIVAALGEALLIGGDAAAALEVYAGARARGLHSAPLTRQLGIALLQSARPREAVMALRAAVREDPSDQRAIAHLGAALAAAGEVDAAERLLGVRRNVHAVELPWPEGFSGADAFHGALAADIRRHSRQRWEPAGLAARQAFLSGDLLADRTPAIMGFEGRLRAAIDQFIADLQTVPGDAFLSCIPGDYRLHVWATQAARAGFIDTHLHEASWLSGAYYVELPPVVAGAPPDAAGSIEFGRPFRNLPPVPERLIRTIQPQVGTLLLFPSYLFHRTLPYDGPGDRISISFDLAQR